jgi:Tol biopolymer transport system component
MLKKISVEGGAPIVLTGSNPIPRGGSWGEDGNIIIASNTGPLQRVSETGGTGTPITEFSKALGDITHRYPQVLPGGKAVLFTAHSQSTGFDGATIEVISLIDGGRKTVHRGGTYGRYLPTGHLVYVNNGTLFALPFDVDRLETHGSPVPVVNDIAYSASAGVALLEFSQTGTLVYAGGGSGLGKMTVQWLYEGDRSEPLFANPGFYQRPRISPDGQRLALEITEGANPGVWIHDLLRGTLTPLTTQGLTYGPLWSPDGRYIVFQASEGISWIRADGAGGSQVLTQSNSQQFPTSFSPDGKRLAFQEATTSATGYDLYTVPIDYSSGIPKAGKPEPFLRAPLDQRHAAFSPDGRWMAFTSNESGVHQIWVRAFPDSGGNWLIGDGQYPLWSKNSELFFRGEEYRIMVAGYSVKGDTFTPEKSRVWSKRVLANTGQISNYDLAPDGKRAVGLVPDDVDQSKAA